MKLPIPKLSPGCLTFLRSCSSFNSTTYLIENERYRTNTNLFMNINNNSAPFVSITWHQKELLGCVLYSYCPTNDSYNKCIRSCCLPCNYAANLFGILQRVIKSQRVCISVGHSKSWHLFFLEKFVAKFSELFFKFSDLMKSKLSKKFDHINLPSSGKNMFVLCLYEKMYSHFKLRMETFSYSVRWFYILILTF